MMSLLREDVVKGIDNAEMWNCSRNNEMIL
jgi:hypothetical protein